MSPHQVRLRWTTHQGTLFAVLQSLLGKNCLVDVTLAAEGQYVRAHKVILCACSPYFEELLSITEDKHPIILLQDVKYVQLQALISYMYCGEVNIDEANLPALLRIAEALQIRGLFSTSPREDCDSSDEADDDHEHEHDPQGFPEFDNESGGEDNNKPDFDSHTHHPVPPKRRKSCGNSTNSLNSSCGPPRASDMLTDSSEDKSPAELSDFSAAVEVVMSSPPRNPVVGGGGKRSGRSERNRRASVSNALSCVEIEGEHDISISRSVDSNSPEPNQAYLFESYFSNEDSFKDEIIAVSPPPPDDDEDHTQEDGLQLGANSDQIFRCFKCGKQYTSNKSLWRHRKFACDGKQTFSCQLCGKSFSRSDNLRRHAVVAHCIQ